MAVLFPYVTALVAIPLLYILSLTVKLIKWLWYLRKISKIVNKFTVNTKSHWLYGHMNIISGANEALLKIHTDWAAEADKGAYALNLLGICPQLELCHPDTVKLVLNTTEQEKGFIPACSLDYKLFLPWLGEGLLTSRGKKWRRNRKLLTPSFHFDILKPYVKIYNECAKKLVASIQHNAQNGQSVQICQIVSLCTLNIIRKCSFSSTEDVQDHAVVSPYVKAVSEITRLIVKRVFNPILYNDYIYGLTSKGKRFFDLCKFTHSIADSVIASRKQQLKNKSPDQQGRFVDFLDILLLARDSEGNGLSDIEIRDEVETFMAAGHDTTATAISWALYNLACHPDIQQKAQQEVDYILDGRCSIEWEDMSHLTCITRCIKESMRLHPPVPWMDRRLTKPLQLGGETLLPGTILDIDIYGLHHNPRVWGNDHMAYNPDRFLPDNMVKMHPHAFIPFSVGPRNCIGQLFAMNVMKTTISLILHNFDLSVDKVHPVKMMPLIVLRAKYGIKLHFQRRR